MASISVSVCAHDNNNKHVHPRVCPSLVTASPYVCLDSGSSNPLHPEKHQQEPWCEGLAMVEAVHHSPAPH